VTVTVAVALSASNVHVVGTPARAIGIDVSASSNETTRLRANRRMPARGSEFTEPLQKVCDEATTAAELRQG
jgi:hypothetical protein